MSNFCVGPHGGTGGCSCAQSEAETHNERGIKAIEYGIVGEVLCYTLRQCLGTAYTPNAHFTWVKILSKILAVMVPVSKKNKIM